MWSVQTKTKTVAHQIPLSVGFPRQECRSRLPFPSLGNLPHPVGMHFLVLTSELSTFGNFVLGFQDAMPLALQSMMELQEISHNKDEEVQIFWFPSG